MEKKLQSDSSDIQERKIPERRLGVRERISPKRGFLKGLLMAVSGAVLATIAGKAKADTFEDYVASFNDPGNIQLLPAEVNTGASNSRCSITPNGNLRWRRGDGGLVSVREVPIIINADGRISVVPPSTTLIGPEAIGYGNSFQTSSGNEFLETDGTVLQKNGSTILDRRMAVDGFYFDGTTFFDNNVAISSNRGRTRSGTADRNDISLLNEGYAGPPMPIIAQADFLANTRSSELNLDPPDRAEVYNELRAVSGTHAFVTRSCTRVLGNCITSAVDNDQNIYMYERGMDDRWNVGSETRVASLPGGSDKGSCVSDDQKAECLFVERVIGGRVQLLATCHCKDPDDDGVNNCRGDNCPEDANVDQSNLDRDPAFHPQVHHLVKE